MCKAFVPFSSLMLVLASVGLSSDSDLSSSLKSHWRALGWKKVAVVYRRENDNFHQRNMPGLVKLCSKNNVSLSFFEEERIRAGTEVIGKEHPVTFLGGDLALDLLRQRLDRKYPPYTTMIFGGSWRGYESALKSLNKSAGFFRLVNSGGNFTLFRVQTFKGQEVIIENEWKLSKDEEDKFVEEVYDLMGAEVASVSDTWEPWEVLHDCDGHGRRCETRGILPQIMNGVARMYNFTWYTDRRVGWGGLPTSGNTSDPE